jgi:riboflavin synthase
MFTGLISHIGKVAKIDMHAEDRIIWISAAKGFIAGLKMGSSVCVNGVCLTVTGLKATQFSVDVSIETLNCTALNAMQKASAVNLEHCLTLRDPLGGHLVSGHVMNTGVIKKMKPEGRSILMEISAPQKIMQYIAPKGCVAIDGVSMTVNRVGTSSFFVNVIPHTFKKTIFQFKQMGDLVNLEADMLMLYIDHLLKGNSSDPVQIWSPELLASWIHASETEH